MDVESSTFNFDNTFSFKTRKLYYGENSPKLSFLLQLKKYISYKMSKSTGF